MTMQNYLRIGLIQPVINPDISWNSKKKFRRFDTDGKTILSTYNLNIDPFTAERVWKEILEGLKLMLKMDEKPHLILIPELHLPISKIGLIRKFSKKHSVVIIAGVDFQRNPKDSNKIRNRGIISIPNKWGAKDFSTRETTLHFGKTFFTYMEKCMFKNIEGVECHEDQEQNMYVFKSNLFGNFGVMICSDIFDIERMMLYQAKIHHLFIISLNKDLNTYFSMAESLSRLIYCNVVVCNTGHFGGSIVVSPYKDPNDRLIYRYHGQKMFNTQVVSIPVKAMDEAQDYDYSLTNARSKFKASPPGYFGKKSR